MAPRTRLWSPMGLAILVAIGCGSGKPQPASAKTESPAQAAPSAVAPAAAGPRGSAAIQVTATLSGTAPASQAIKMDADPVCQQQHTSLVRTEEVVTGAGGELKNVLVYVKSGLGGSYPAPAAPVTFNQSGCWYVPHVFGIQVNQPLEIVNSDATLHNVNAKPTANPAFNIAQPVKGMKTTKKFPKPELPVKFKCNVHPWMSAYAGVFEHPFFAVTDAQGAAALSGLPAGTYVVEAWHEVYGTQTQTVTVADGETKATTWTFKAQ